MGQMLEGIADPAGQTIAAFESDAEYQLAALRCAALRLAREGRIQGPRSHPGAKVASRTGDSASVLQLGPLVMRWCNRYDVSTG